jgi:hypothetical protein
MSTILVCYPIFVLGPLMKVVLFRRKRLARSVAKDILEMADLLCKIKEITTNHFLGLVGIFCIF